YATSIRNARSTGDPTGWMATAQLHLMSGAYSRPAASWPPNSARGSSRAGPSASPRPGGGARPPATRSFRHRPGRGHAGAAMRGPHSWYEKSTWIVQQERLVFAHGIDPSELSADSEPRSRTAESRRCGRSERRAPDDPAGGSPNRDLDCFIGSALIRERRGNACEEELGNAAVCRGQGVAASRHGT